MTRQVRSCASPGSAAIAPVRAAEPKRRRSGGDRQKLEHYLDVAKGEITRLDYIVTQFFQAIRPSPPQLAPGSLNDVARETLELLRPELENRRLKVKEKLARRAAAGAAGRGQIKQVLVNLIKNAMQAMTARRLR